MARRADKGGQRLRPPLRKSLLGRFLAVSALVAACSVAATAWLAVQTTSGAIEQEQGRNLAADTRVLDTLLAYAARHPTWDGVGATVDELADASDRRITLTTQSRQILADSAGSSPPPPSLPPQASAVVDPLSVADVSSGSGSGAGSVTIAAPGTDGTQRPGTDRVDPRAVGPFELSEAERTSLRRTADEAVQCLSRTGIASDVVEGRAAGPASRSWETTPTAWTAAGVRRMRWTAPPGPRPRRWSLSTNSSTRAWTGRDAKPWSSISTCRGGRARSLFPRPPYPCRRPHRASVSRGGHADRGGHARAPRQRQRP